MRLMSNVVRDISCRELFKTLNVLPLPYMYIKEIIYCIKINIGRLEQNSGIIIIHVIDQIFNTFNKKCK